MKFTKQDGFSGRKLGRAVKGRLFLFSVVGLFLSAAYNNCGKGWTTLDLEAGLPGSSDFASESKCPSTSAPSPISQSNLNSPFASAKVIIHQTPSLKASAAAKLTKSDLIAMETPLLVILAQPCLATQTDGQLAASLGDIANVDISKLDRSMTQQAFPILLKGETSMSTLQEAASRNTCVVGITNNERSKISQVSIPGLSDRQLAFSNYIRLNQVRSLNSKIQQGTPIRVAVVDTGVEVTHPAFAGLIESQQLLNTTRQPARDGNGHGTHVAGLVAQAVNGDPRVIQIIPIKSLEDDGTGSDSDIYNGVLLAIQKKADVINLSLSSTSIQSATIQRTYLVEALNSNAVVVVAAGNDGKRIVAADVTGNWSFPASFAPATGLISVGSVDLSSNQRSSFSNYGDVVDLATVGCYQSPTPSMKVDVGLYSTALNGSYELRCGTSMATPIIAGMAALMLKTHRLYRTALSNTDAEAQMKAATFNPGSVELSRYFNYQSFLDRLIALTVPVATPTTTTTTTTTLPSPIPSPMPAPPGSVPMPEVAQCP